MLKPQDVLVSLKFLSPAAEARQTYSLLAESLALSVSETHACIRRVVQSRLILPSAHRPDSLAEMRPSPRPLSELLCHGVPYFLPAEAGSLVTGIPTAGDAPPLISRLARGDAPPLVWAHSRGSVRGLSVEPIYPSAPDAALRDPALAEWLALTDALRLGPGRLAELAREEIGRRLQEHRYAAAA